MLKGEEIKLGIQPPQVIDRPDQEINEKYVKGEVRIVTEQARYPLSSIPQMLDSDNYLLRPEYQRRHRWSNEKKSRLIESLVMNVPIPPIFLYEYEYSKYEVMDGLQRLSTIQEFYSNQLELTGLTEWEELNGRTYSSLPDRVRAGIDRRYLSSIILLQETAKTGDEARILKQLVFERINSGGERLMPHSSTSNISRYILFSRSTSSDGLNKSSSDSIGIPHMRHSECRRDRLRQSSFIGPGKTALRDS